MKDSSSWQYKQGIQAKKVNSQELCACPLMAIVYWIKVIEDSASSSWIPHNITKTEITELVCDPIDNVGNPPSSKLRHRHVKVDYPCASILCVWDRRWKGSRMRNIHNHLKMQNTHIRKRKINFGSWSANSTSLSIDNSLRLMRRDLEASTQAQAWLKPPYSRNCNTLRTESAPRQSQ